MLPGAMHLEPLAQGNLSCLCGLYSHINGIRLALYPLKLQRQEVQALYLEGIRHLSSTRQLKHVLGVGMAERLWMSLGAALLAHVNATHAASLKLVLILNGAAKHDRERALSSIRKAVTVGQPVVVSLNGALDHYTTICGFTATRLVLFDSSNLSWVEQKNVGLGDRSRRRHWFDPAAALSIIDDW